MKKTLLFILLINAACIGQIKGMENNVIDARSECKRSYYKLMKNIGGYTYNLRESYYNALNNYKRAIIENAREDMMNPENIIPTMRIHRNQVYEFLNTKLEMNENLRNQDIFLQTSRMNNNGLFKPKPANNYFTVFSTMMARIKNAFRFTPKPTPTIETEPTYKYYNHGVIREKDYRC